jgi:hypothetical protein
VHHVVNTLGSTRSVPSPTSLFEMTIAATRLAAIVPDVVMPDAERDAFWQLVGQRPAECP